MRFDNCKTNNYSKKCLILFGIYRMSDIMSFSVLNITVKEKELFLDFQGGNHAVFDYFFDKYEYMPIGC